MPRNGEPFTWSQIDEISNFRDYYSPGDSLRFVKGWHQGPDGGGLFEPWSRNYGYPDGYPLYADISINGVTHHVYWLPNKIGRAHV